MFKDLQQFNSNQVLTADVCIVGSGPAGMSVAKKLLGTKNKVLFLESGGEEPSVEYNKLNKGKNSGSRFLSLDASRMRCFGGASRIWAGVCSPFDEEDFNSKSFVALSGWPIARKVLHDYYHEAAEMLGISYEAFDNSDSFTNSLNGLSFPEFNRKDSLLTNTIYQHSDSTNRNFGKKYKKLFSDSKNIDVLFHATVTKLNVAKNGKKIQSVQVEDLSGKKCTINATIYVLASGALENPRLLLNSFDYFSYGIGNENGFVGSCFMSHPGFSAVGEVFKTSKGFCISNNSYSSNLTSQFSNSSSTNQSLQILRHGLDMKYFRDLANPSTYFSGRLLTEYEKLFKNFSLREAIQKTSCRFKGEYSSNLWNVGVSIEQEPSKRNYLKLNNSSKDIFGVPTIDMFWSEISNLEKKTVVESLKGMGREFALSDSGRVRLTEALLSEEIFQSEDSVNHHIGTTRMAKTSDKGVVDKNCKVFNLSNLYIAGSSVFPTSSIVNPTFTIIALALRLGDHLKSELV